MARFERILLTGGSGFVGSYLSQALASAYPEARRTVLTRPGEPFVGADWTPVTADLLDEAALEAVARDLKPDLVVHLAGQASIGRALGAAELTWRVNFHGSFNLAAALARHVPQTTVLFSSSASIYGESLRLGPADESTPLRPIDAYGCSKAAAEAAFGDILAQGSRLIIARPVNHSGPRQTSASFVLASFAAQIAGIESGRLEPRLHVGDLSKARDFLDVRDVVDAYLALIGASERLPDRISVFNVASGEARTIKSLLESLRAIAARPFEVAVDESRLRPVGADVPRASIDAAHLRAATGWRPRRSIDEMLQSLLDYWREVERTLK
jgi:GDP-4-dehydro-6-deoxy-D-mannose reductase